MRPPRRPPLPPPLPPLDQRGQHMTIAAGFVCSDGVVLGADTQVTGQTIKYSRDKVWVLSAPDASHCVAMAGAGDAVLIRALRDHLASHDQSGRLQLAETLSRLSAVRAGRVRRAGVPGAHGDDLGRANTDYRRRDPLRPLRRPALGRSSPTGSEAGCRRACCSAPSNNGRYSGQWAPTDRRPLAASSTVLRRAVPRPFAFFAVAALCMPAATNRYRPFPSLLKCVWVEAAPVLCLHSRGTASRSTRRASGSHRRDARSPAACC